MGLERFGGLGSIWDRQGKGVKIDQAIVEIN
jgi:hypothetical protein